MEATVRDKVIPSGDSGTPAWTLQPLSLTQRYFLGVIVDEGFDPSWQHICLAIRLKGTLDRGRVQEVVARLGERHPVLATRLAYHEGKPFLAPCSDARPCEVTALEGAREQELDMWVSHRADQPFDLLEGPLWRVVLVSDGAETSILSFVCHHLVADGMSSWTLVKDFGALYSGADLGPEPPGYAEFVAEERELLEGPELERRMAYWEGLLDGANPRLELEHRPTTGELGSGRTVALELPEGSGAALVAHARARRVTPLALLSGATFSAVREATGQGGLLAAVVTDIRGGRFASTVGAFSDLMLVRDPASGRRDADGHLPQLRNEFFNGWKSHLPIGYLRERLPCFARSTGNPCDLFLNFIPVRTSSAWFELMGSYADHAPEYHALQHRIGSPSRRFHAPLYFVSFIHAMELAGWVEVKRDPRLEALNGAILAGLQASASAVAVPLA